MFPLGFLGLHHFYLRRPKWGVLYLLTGGCAVIGWLIDFFRLPSLVRETNLQVEREAAIMIELENRLHGQQQPIEMPPDQNPPRYTPGSMPVRYSHHPSSAQRSARTENTPLHVNIGKSVFLWD